MLIVTGRGNQSDGGVSVVREAVIRLLLVLKRRGVVTGHEEHTPGSFVVTLAPRVGALGIAEAESRPRCRAAAAERRRRSTSSTPKSRVMLRNLAERALEGLGIKDTDDVSPGRNAEAIRRDRRDDRRRAGHERSGCARRFAPRSISTSSRSTGAPRASAITSLPHLSHPGINRARLVFALALSRARRRRGSAAIDGRIFVRPTPRRQRELEASADQRPSPPSASAHSKQLSRETHVAGTPAQARTRDYVIEQMKKWGIETEVRAYDVWMPHPTSVRVARVSPAAERVRAGRAAGRRRPDVDRSWQYPTVNGYSGEGDVTAEVVYVNYGLIEDYAQLDSMGVSVKGKIAMARYGRSFRGIKAREAEKHGAVGLLIYSDPQDDGFVVGDVYPEGPMRNSAGVQRGSILNPEWRSVDAGIRKHGGRRRGSRPTRWRSRTFPVVPIGYGNASELLKYVRGAAVPRGVAGRFVVSLSRWPGTGEGARRREGRSRDEADEADL